MKIKPSVLPVVCLVAAMFFGAGCASSHVENTSPSTQTWVSLNHANYKLIQAGATGRSYGFRFFLGIIPIASPTTAAARADLYKNIGQPLNGKSVALINVAQERSTTWLLLFSIPKMVITGDVVEFGSEDMSGPPPAAQLATPQ